MDSLFPRDSSPRSKQSLGELIKEKVRGADVVAVGVNLVVGALLIGGVIGATMSVKEVGAQPADVNAAALVAGQESDANQTEPASEPGGMDASSEHDEDDEEDASDK